ncbi:ATP-dependent helicase [Bdellovibrio sp. qaytius]|nr:ATP-dependent helicase [Bdellovibrio sp. qaytius]
MKYVDLNLDSRLQTNITNLGYVDATPIQVQAFEPIISGKDVAGLAQTGTGKTAAFLIPLIERILKAETNPESERAFVDWKAFNQVLILVPTRELADQIHENILKLTAGTGLKSATFYGGTGYDKQKEALSGNLQFMVSTPGRLIDLYKEHHVDFKKVKAIIFDEADRMFDMGFKDDMKYILSRIERTRQFLVFSATLNFDVLNTAYQFGSEPFEINISKDVAKAENVKDMIYHVGNHEKPQFLLSIFKKQNPTQTIIFTNFKNNVDRVAHFLTDNGIPAMGISSLMSQAQRTQVISRFKESNNQNVLVATDVAARGLDISDVDLVVNYELPQDCESYVHRIGRTGRAGKEGKAFSLVSDRDVESLYRIEEFTKKKIETGFMEDTELVKDFKALAEEPKFRKSFDRPGGKPQGGRGRSAESGRPERSDRKPGFNRDHDGKPHAAGPREDRGPRPHGDRKPHQDRGPRDDRGPREDRGPRDEQRPRHDKKPMHAKHDSAHPNAGPKHSHGKPHAKHDNKRDHKPHSKVTPAHLTQKRTGSHRKPVPQAGLVNSVKSFFKKLFT